MKQGDAQERMGGVYFQVYANETTDVMFGAYYRISDAITPFAGFYYKGLTLGLSYDVDASAKSAAGSKGNSMEISIVLCWQTEIQYGCSQILVPAFLVT